MIEIVNKWTSRGIFPNGTVTTRCFLWIAEIVCACSGFFAPHRTRRKTSSQEMEARRVAAKEKTTTRAWWLDTNTYSKRSQWLITTLAELEEKTKEMLKLIEEDADSFAKRAEMYYEKRPELMSMIEDFYRAHRSLAERYDQLRVEGALRRTTSFDSSFLDTIWSTKVKSVVDKSSKSSLDSFDYSEESEVDDPDLENHAESGLRELPNKKSDNDEDKLSSEVEKLKKENETLKAELVAKDEEKREVIRQLSMSVDILKEENRSLWKCVRDSKKWGGFLEFKKLKNIITSGKLFSRLSKSKTTVVAL